MDQGLHVGQHLDDGADLEDLADLGGVVLAEVGALVVVLEHFRGLGQGFGGGGEDGDLAGVVDVHGRAGGRGDGLDVLAAGADDEADDVGIDVDLGVLGRVLGELRAGAGEDLGHLAEDVQAAFVGLAHGCAHDVGGEAFDLDVHLDAGDAFGRAGNLEVHVAHGVLVAEDVGEDDELVAFLDEAHGNARHGSADRHARVHEGEAAAAHGGHGGGAVGLEGLGDYADGEGKLSCAGSTGRRDFSARAPWPISRRERRTGFTSPTQKGGKL